MTFNLSKRNDDDLLKYEMESFKINKQKSGTYSLEIGDELVDAGSLSECKQYIKEGIAELKNDLWDAWSDLSHISQIIVENNSGNSDSLDNVLFLSTAKRAFALSCVFSDLKEVSRYLKQIFTIDASEVHHNLISKFNAKYFDVKMRHSLLMRELYRLSLISKYMKLHKAAQISGPWANLDLPMKERVWDYSEDEEYFEGRSKAKRNQVRYNPEMLPSTGFYYVWQDLNRDPFQFSDRDEESPYKSRKILQIATKYSL